MKHFVKICQCSCRFTVSMFTKEEQSQIFFKSIFVNSEQVLHGWYVYFITVRIFCVNKERFLTNHKFRAHVFSQYNFTL